MQERPVRKRGWVDDQKFLDMLGISNLIPGPTATEMALYLGLERAGWLGYLASGLLFIIPGMIATIALAWGYVMYGWAAGSRMDTLRGETRYHRYCDSGSMGPQEERS